MMKIQAPNILVTNFCNQNCSFCFAKTEMNNKYTEKEIKLNNFIKILRKIKKNKIPVVNLMGGEPTLHSQFENIVRTSFQYASLVKIFTNGLFSQKIANFLKDQSSNVILIFNITTPAFLNSQTAKEIITNNILSLSPYNRVALSLTINPNNKVSSILNSLNSPLLKSVLMIRIGIANPISPGINSYNFSHFSIIGQQIYEIIKYISKINPKIKFSLNCGFTRCMFSKPVIKYLKNKLLKSIKWGCFGKTGSFDINVNLDSFHCFSLSSQKKLQTLSNPLLKIDSSLLLERYALWNSYVSKTCQKCLHYGVEENKCPGPCIAFIQND